MFDYNMGIMVGMGRKGGVGMALSATIGFAFGDGDDGVAYVRLVGDGRSEQVQRISVGLNVRPALLGRDEGYAALLAVSTELRKQGVRAVDFEITDEQLVRDLTERRPVPATLAMPYVLLGCALNRFTSSTVTVCESAEGRDLTARARADVSMHVAA
jgi:hypothetical protein